MRFNLSTPFAEKDQAKALGARWDYESKVWYVLDVEDLTPFMRWKTSVSKSTHRKRAFRSKPTNTKNGFKPRTTVSTGGVDCGCDVLPWDHCEHTQIPKHTNDRPEAAALAELQAETLADKMVIRDSE